MYGELIAESKVLLSVALGDLDGVVDVLDGHGVVGNILDTTRAASALQVSRQCRGNTRPDLDASTILDVVLAFTQHEQSVTRNTYRGIEHRNVVNENVLNNIDFVLVLAQGTNGDTVRAVAMEVLDDNVGAVGLEGDAV